MEIELIGALDYAKVKELLGAYVSDEEKIDSIIKNLKDVETSRHSEIVSTAGRLSRFPGNVLEVLKNSEGNTSEKNNKFINFVIGMGHRSITDHDYLVFALKDVSAIVEQMIIAERFSSFTIKSRREVDFSTAGYFVPDFHNDQGIKLKNNEEIKDEYKNHMDSLFGNYKKLVDDGVSTEDARFILPYSYHSNIMMGIDAHTLLDMIIKYTKTKYAKVTELREFGLKLYDIASVYTPYLIPLIDSIDEDYTNSVDEYLSKRLDYDYKIIDKVKLLNSSDNVDDTILISAIMRRYQYDYETAKKKYEELSASDPKFKEELMRLIAFNSDRLELTQVDFNFQIPVSYAILTHLTRHRTHDIIVPDFFPIVDLTQYKTPPKFKNNYQEFYDNIFKDNKEEYDRLKKLGIRDEDLIYFTLSGNMTNILTNMNGWTVRHILELRECNKAQWETRDIANGIHKEIDDLDHAQVFSSILGPTCETMGICNEGKESCGKVKVLNKKENE